ncbi:unnamed protein product [Didymodactylos carnosus]|uniref:Uncharacterized protein n=1 Tax=Didymodactylos carnosus TaxID=1234261 RepID=A0A813XTS9_9BILA|nr:unnamed protein product [Didymodactylos carnosus]CAF1311261.1 unnamed protein product [Didymodactylos carnosus]CAF3657372.1 unnamed protein product [Didymodactylos carnosus]CAF4119311.1 unnamed protein product [Didymodactylos carnosus]
MIEGTMDNSYKRQSLSSSSAAYMKEFQQKFDNLTSRITKGHKQCEHIEMRACLAEKRLCNLNYSVQKLSRLIEVSYLCIDYPDEKQAWIQAVNDLIDPIYSLELLTQHSLTNLTEKDNNKDEHLIEENLFDNLKTSSSLRNNPVLIKFCKRLDSHLKRTLESEREKLEYIYAIWLLAFTTTSTSKQH